MCGLAGLLRPTPDTGADRLSGLARAMGDAMVHRGPDDSGVWVDEQAGVALGAPAPEHPRPVAAGPSADGLGRPSLRHRLQRRDLQLRRIARGAGRAGPCVPRPFRYRGAAGRGGGVGRRGGRSRVATACSRSRCGTGRSAACGWPATASARSRCITAGPATRSCSGPSSRRCGSTRPSTTRSIRDALALLLRLDYIPAPHAIHVDTFKLMPGSLLRVDAAGRRARRAGP